MTTSPQGDAPLQHPVLKLACDAVMALPWMMPLADELDGFSIVGGWVRDRLLGQPFDPTKAWDIDLVLPPVWDAPKLIEALPTLKARCEATLKTHPAFQHCTMTAVVLDASWGIARLVVHPVSTPVPTETNPPEEETPSSLTSTYPLQYIDLAVCQGATLEEDLHRRDLTVNAMAVQYTPQTRLWRWVDPYAGYNDLMAHTLRGIARENFIEDPLRLLRTARFLATLPDSDRPSKAMADVSEAWRIEADTRHWLETLAPLIEKPAGERLHVELCKLLSVRRCYPAVALLAETGLLEVMFPCLTPMRFVPPNTHHHLPLFEHTLELLHQSDNHLASLPDWWQDALTHALTPYANGLCVVRLAALFHDVGKPDTWVIKDDGRHTFYGHDHVSANIFQKHVVPRLKLSHKLKHPITQLIQYHLYPCQISPQSTPKAITRFYTKMGTLTPWMVFLGMIDTASTRGEARPEAIHEADMADLMWLGLHWHTQRATLARPSLLSGEEVMALCGLTPSKKVGELLKALKEAQVVCPLHTKEEATTWLISHYPTAGSGND